MHYKPKVAVSWSGGKDSALALYEVLKAGDVEVKELFTTYNAQYNRVSIHGVRKDLVKQQAHEINLPIKFIQLKTNSFKEFEEKMNEYFCHLKQKGISHIVYGDIFLEDLKNYRDTFLHRLGMKGLYPLWGISTNQLINKFLNLGFTSVVCAVHTKSLSEDFLGKQLSKAFIRSLPAGVDVCGENGEFHTFCTNAPYFNSPIEVKTGRKHFAEYAVNDTENATIAYIDLLL